jgi:hypothetical protein
MANDSHRAKLAEKMRKLPTSYNAEKATHRSSRNWRAFVASREAFSARFTDEAWITAFQLALNLPSNLSNEFTLPTVCPTCNHLTDGTASHALLCASTSGHRTRRHTIMKDALINAVVGVSGTSSNITCEAEPVLSHHPQRYGQPLPNAPDPHC